MAYYYAENDNNEKRGQKREMKKNDFVSSSSSSSSSLRLRWFDKSSLSALSSSSDVSDVSMVLKRTNNDWKILDCPDDVENDDDPNIYNAASHHQSSIIITAAIDDHIFGGILWNMLRIAAHETTMEPIQSNPDLAKYVTNMLMMSDDDDDNTTRNRNAPITSIHPNMQQDQLQQQQQHHHEQQQQQGMIIRMGVMADWIIQQSNDDEGGGLATEDVVGAAWIQTWPNNVESNIQPSSSNNHTIISMSTTNHQDDSHPSPPHPSPRGYGWVRDDIPELAMAIAPDYQGQGIGTRLLAALIQQVQRHNRQQCQMLDHHGQHQQEQQQQSQQGLQQLSLHASIPGISLSVREDNLLAVRLYERHGFQVVPDSRVKNRVGTWSCTMIRWLHA